MTIHLRPDQETHLAQLATRTGRPANQLAQDAIDALLEHDAWFSEKVAEGIAQLDKAEAVGHAAVADDALEIVRILHGRQRWPRT